MKTTPAAIKGNKQVVENLPVLEKSRLVTMVTLCYHGNVTLDTLQGATEEVIPIADQGFRLESIFHISK